MADVKVQRGTTAIPDTAATATITAGTDYTAPTGEAFIRLVNVFPSGGGVTGSFNEATEDWTAYISNPSNLGTSVTFERAGIAGEVIVSWEIIEDVAGGANAFVVRSAETIAVASNETSADTATVSGVSNDGDVVVFVTGVSLDTATNGDANGMSFTSEWVGASNVGRVTRGSAIGGASVSVAVVEFTGSNWTIQRATHSYTAAGAVETETITAVGALSEAFLHSQLRTASPNLDEAGQEAWLSATDTLSFQIQSGADVGHDAVVWVIENPGLSVQHVSGSRATGGGSPDTWTETITAVSALADASVMGETSRCTGTGAAVDRNAVNLRLATTTTVELRTPEDGQTQSYRFQVVEWPTGGGGTPVSNTHPTHYEHLLTGTLPEPTTYEHLHTATGAEAVFYEHLAAAAAVSSTHPAFYEHLQKASSTASAAYEHLATALLARSADYEHLQTAAASEGVAYEHLATAARVTAAFYEHLGAATSVSKTEPAFYEHLLSGTSEQAVGYEHLQEASATRAALYEHLATVLATSPAPYEHLVTALTSAAVFYEHLGSPSSVSATEPVFYEHLQATLQSTSTSYEHLATVAALERAVYEHLATVSATHPAFYEHLGPDITGFLAGDPRVRAMLLSQAKLLAKLDDDPRLRSVLLSRPKLDKE